VQSDGGHKTAHGAQGRVEPLGDSHTRAQGHRILEDLAPRRLGVLMIRGYQLARAGKPSPCRFIPSCSEYAVEALEVHGLLRGLWLSTRRLLRCRPGGGFGVDLVPDPPRKDRKGRVEKYAGVAGNKKPSLTGRAR